MEPRISLITLGVEDVGTSVDFYTRLGFGEATQTSEYCAFFRLEGGLVLSLYRREHLFRETRLEDAGPRFNGVSFAHNTRSELEVDKLPVEVVGDVVVNRNRKVRARQRHRAAARVRLDLRRIQRKLRRVGHVVD